MRSLGLAFPVWLLTALATSFGPAPIPTAGSDLAGSDLAVMDTTIVDSVDAGSVFIMALPERLSGKLVKEYKPIRMPAMGWMADRSFFWRLPSDAEGNYRFEFRAVRDDASEIVHLRVFVNPSDG